MLERHFAVDAGELAKVSELCRLLRPRQLLHLDGRHRPRGCCEVKVKLNNKEKAIFHPTCILENPVRDTNFFLQI